jgi:RimJ/RimL family protein N-acetyltransferase
MTQLAPAGTVFETERLVVRRFVGDDVEALHSYLSLPEVCRWVPFEPQTLEQTRERVGRKIAQGWHPDEELRALALAVVRRADGRMVGDLVCFSEDDPVHRQAEIGYSFHPDVAGHRYATESVRGLVTWVFANLDLHRLTARVDVENVPSWRLLERLGFRREAHLRENEWFKGHWSDEYDYAVLAHEWPPTR